MKEKCLAFVFPDRNVQKNPLICRDERDVHKVMLNSKEEHKKLLLYMLYPPVCNIGRMSHALWFCTPIINIIHHYKNILQTLANGRNKSGKKLATHLFSPASLKFLIPPPRLSCLVWHDAGTVILFTRKCFSAFYEHGSLDCNCNSSHTLEWKEISRHAFFS